MHAWQYHYAIVVHLVVERHGALYHVRPPAILRQIRDVDIDMSKEGAVSL